MRHAGIICLLALGCGGGKAKVGSQAGQLTVTISSPTTVAPSVAVTGPGGFSRTLSVTTTLGALAAGSYTVTPALARAPGAVIGTEYAAAGPTVVAIAAGTDAGVAVNYTPRLASGQAWIPDDGLGSLVSFDDAQLADGGDHPFTTGVSLVSGLFTAMAFDQAGNGWVANDQYWLDGGANVRMFSAASLAGSGAPQPTLTLISVPRPDGLAFDAQGNLWVLDYEVSGGVMRFRPDQLPGSGAVTATPDATFTGLYFPQGMAFGPDGALYVDARTPGQIWKYTPAQLAATGTVTSPPAATITPSGVTNPYTMAFDRNGTLWILEQTASPAGVVGFTATQLAGASGAVTLTPALGFSSSALAQPSGLAFDDNGDLWVVNSPLSLTRFAYSEIVAANNNAINPSTVLTNSSSPGSTPSVLVFNPPGLGGALFR